MTGWKTHHEWVDVFHVAFPIENERIFPASRGTLSFSDFLHLWPTNSRMKNWPTKISEFYSFCSVLWLVTTSPQHGGGYLNKPWLFDIGDEILPSYMGIKINHEIRIPIKQLPFKKINTDFITNDKMAAWWTRKRQHLSSVAVATNKTQMLFQRIQSSKPLFFSVSYEFQGIYLGHHQPCTVFFEKKNSMPQNASPTK